MNNCLVCDESTINLLNIKKCSLFYKNNNKLHYSDNENSNLTFSYCLNCFHCQNEIKNQNFDQNSSRNKFILNTIEDDLIYTFINNDNTLCITDGLSKITNVDQLPIQNFLDLKNSTDKYNTIIFYKSFDKTKMVKDILKLTKKMLCTGGEIIIITSTENVVRDKKFNYIGSNIVSFFSTNSMKTLCEKFDFSINKLNKYDNYSVYYIKSKSNEIGSSNDVIRYLYTDIEENIYDDKLYVLFNLHALFYKAKLQKKLLKSNISRLNHGKLLIGYGLDEYSINLINFCELTDEYIDYFISFELNNLIIPGTFIKINNYWEQLNKNEHDSFDIIIVNFTRDRINDRVFTLFKELYNNISVIEIH